MNENVCRSSPYNDNFDNSGLIKRAMLWIASCAGLAAGIECLRRVAPCLRRLAMIPIAMIPSDSKDPGALRVGILGAAKIAPAAVVWPASKMTDVVIAAVAARDQSKARAFAKAHRIPKVHASYQALIEDESIDAVYNPLPNGLHAVWTIKALQAGKHVLCEKPFASNAEEAAAVLKVVNDTQLVCVEAFHYRFHPAVHRFHEMIGEVGQVKSVETAFEIPFPFIRHNDIRYDVRGTDRSLAGGSLMDAGCYAVNCMRYLVGAEPTAVTEASVVEAFPGVDESATATFAFAGGITARIRSSFRARWFNAQASVHGSEGSLRIFNFLAPFLYHFIELRDSSGRVVRTEKIYGNGETTYEHQLRAFVGAVRRDPAAAAACESAGSVAESVSNMRVIDMIYQAAGLARRRGMPLQ